MGPVNPPSRGYIWILVATEYFTKWAEAVSLRKATEGVVTNFIKENIIIRFGVPHRIISDNGTPFVNNNVRKMLEFYQVKHHRSSPYYPQGNGQAEVTNKTLIEIMTAISFSPFSLVYGTEVVSPAEIMTPSLRVMQMQEKEKEEEVFAAERHEDLEGLDEKREKA